MANEIVVWQEEFQKAYDEGGLILGRQMYIGNHYTVYTKDKSLQRVVDICIQAHKRIDNLEKLESEKIKTIKSFSLLDFWRWKTGRKTFNQF